MSELKKYNGVEDKLIYICAKGIVYDMSSAPGFYGPDGAYGVFSGHDASRNLALMR